MDASVSAHKVIEEETQSCTPWSFVLNAQYKWWQQQERGLNRQRAFLTYWILYYWIHSSWVNMHILDPGEVSSPPLQVLLGKISRPSHMHSTNMQGQPLHAPWYSPPKGRKKKTHQLNSLNQCHAFMRFENPALAYNPVYATGPVTFWREVQLELKIYSDWSWYKVQVILRVEGTSVAWTTVILQNPYLQRSCSSWAILLPPQNTYLWTRTSWM